MSASFAAVSSVGRLAGLIRTPGLTNRVILMDARAGVRSSLHGYCMEGPEFAKGHDRIIDVLAWDRPDNT